MGEGGEFLLVLCDNIGVGMGVVEMKGELGEKEGVLGKGFERVLE